MPEFGASKEALLEELRAKRSQDTDWKQGETPLHTFKATDDVFELVRSAFFENALGDAHAFPSVKQMESSVVGVGLRLRGAPSSADLLRVDARQARREESSRQHGSDRIGALGAREGCAAVETARQADRLFD